jgi:hypothetical protein
VIFVGLNMYQISLKYLPYLRYTRKERNKCRLMDLPGSSASGLWHHIILCTDTDDLEVCSRKHVSACEAIHGVTTQKTATTMKDSKLKLISHVLSFMSQYEFISILSYISVTEIPQELKDTYWTVSHWSYRAQSRYCTVWIIFHFIYLKFYKIHGGICLGYRTSQQYNITYEYTYMIR